MNACMPFSSVFTMTEYSRMQCSNESEGTKHLAGKMSRVVGNNNSY